MKIYKKAIAAVLALSMLAAVTGCSTNKSWAMKTDTFTAPIGTYIYYLSAAYQTAGTSVKDTTKPVLEQKIDNQSAETWIKNKALTYTKELFLVDDKMKEMKLSLTDDETKSISTDTDSKWSQYSSVLEGYGISKSSYSIAATEYEAKLDKIFYALYGKDGKNEVSDADLKSYFEKNYADFSYIQAPLYKADASGNYAALTDAEKAKIKTEFDGYAADVSSGKKTMQQAADAYKASSKQTEEQLKTATGVLNSSSSADDISTVIKAMKNGEVKAVDQSASGFYILIQKNDITKKTTQSLSGDSRKSVLLQMKWKEFSDKMETEAKSYSKATVNQSAIDSYNPSMFVTASSSSAAATSSK